MGFTKIEESDLIGKLVSELPDIPEMTADELKKWFDSLAKDVIIPRFNQLSKELDDSGISNSVKAENVKYIRVNDDKQLEYSEDGKKYETIGSSGHLIVDEDGNELPTRGRIKFAEELEVSDSEETNETIVRKAGIDYSELEFDTNEVVVEDQENERTIISDAYSTKTPYSVDDYCIYADVLYRCIAETSGAFDATCWEKTLVASELKQLSSKTLTYNSDTDYFGCTYNGVWHDILSAGLQRHWLYNAGDEITHITGGWTESGYTYHSDVTESGTLTKEDSYLLLTVNATSRASSTAGTENMIDLTNYNTVKFTFVNTSTGEAIEKSLDVSSLAVSAYIAFALDYTVNGLFYGVVSSKSGISQESVRYAAGSYNGFSSSKTVRLKYVELI